MSQGFQGAMEANLALTEVALQSDDKLAAKNLSEHGDGKKEARARWNPTRVIERQPAGGHHTMGMGVMFEFLIPGVKHAKEADLGAEMFGVAGDFEEGFGAGLQQQMRKRLPQRGFVQVVVSKATAADSDEATNFSSAVASDTTLGLLARVVESLFWGITSV